MRRVKIVTGHYSGETRNSSLTGRNNKINTRDSCTSKDQHRNLRRHTISLLTINTYAEARGSGVGKPEVPY